MENLTRYAKIICPLCGNDQFGFVDCEYTDPMDAPDDAVLRCSDCGSTYTKAELLGENQESISNTLEEMMEDLQADLAQQLKEMFRL